MHTAVQRWGPQTLPRLDARTPCDGSMESRESCRKCCVVGSCTRCIPRKHAYFSRGQVHTAVPPFTSAAQQQLISNNDGLWQKVRYTRQRKRWSQVGRTVQCRDYCLQHCGCTEALLRAKTAAKQSPCTTTCATQHCINHRVHVLPRRFVCVGITFDVRRKERVLSLGEVEVACKKATEWVRRDQIIEYLRVI